jgi:hypothetical protein
MTHQRPGYIWGRTTSTESRLPRGICQPERNAGEGGRQHLPGALLRVVWPALTVIVLLVAEGAVMGCWPAVPAPFAPTGTTQIETITAAPTAEGFTPTATPKATSTAQPTPALPHVTATARKPTATLAPTHTLPQKPTSTAAIAQKPSMTPTARPKPTHTPTAAPKPASTPTMAESQTPGLVLDFERERNWRRGDQPYGQFDRSTEQMRSGSYSGRLRYDFPAVNDNFVVFVTQPPIQLAGKPAGLAAWVYGDGAGHFLNVWIRDANGEVRQYTFGRVSHQGWQSLTAPFDDGRGWPNGHISGHDSGVLDYPVSLYAIVLDGFPDGQASSGVIYLDDVTFAEHTISVEQPTSPPPPPPPPTNVGESPPAISTPIPGGDYGPLTINGSPTDRPAEAHADLNLALRGYEPTDANRELVDYSGGTHANTPQLPGLFADERTPAFSSVYRVYDWNWDCNCRGNLISDWEVTLAGLEVSPGETIHVPSNGQQIGDGYQVLVLYASPERITLKYTRDDNVVRGYTLHVEGVCVDPGLLNVYQSMNAAGRERLPALRAGQSFGRACGNEIRVAIRDNGTFMDPRSRKDWWQGR